MRRWSYALGGLIAWSAHFAAACGILLTMAGRRLRSRPRNGLVLMDQLAAVGAGIGLVAIAWQAVAVLA